MLLTVKDSPYEIDTAVHEGCRWVQVWTGNDCIAPFESIDEAVEFIESHMGGVEDKDNEN